MKRNFRTIVMTVIFTLVAVYFISQLFGNNLGFQTGIYQARSLFPFAIFLLCPLMHLFMMRSHGGHGGGCCGGKENDTVEENADNDEKQSRPSCH